MPSGAPRSRAFRRPSRCSAGGSPRKDSSPWRVPRPAAAARPLAIHARREGLPAGRHGARDRRPLAFRQPSSPVELDDFWLDRHEVTNRAYKEFVDQGGYRTRDYWKQPFLKDGRTLSWEEAMGSFRDATGRPGPATWELGTYPDGQGEYPVGGVSWFEAAAYARVRGQGAAHLLSLVQGDGHRPDLFLFADIIDFSNFRGQGPVAVGSLGGTSPFGSSDMAGNVREWCATVSGRERYILGGGWDEPAHVYIQETRLSPVVPARHQRLPVRAVHGSASGHPRGARRVGLAELFGGEACFGRSFRSYRAFYSYDRTRPEGRRRGGGRGGALAAREGLVRCRLRQRARAGAPLPPPQREAALSDDRVPPARRGDCCEARATTSGWRAFDFIIRSGRAVLYPVYKGTYERRSDRRPDRAERMAGPRRPAGQGLPPFPRLPGEPPGHRQGAAGRARGQRVLRALRAGPGRPAQGGRGRMRGVSRARRCRPRSTPSTSRRGSGSRC